jgi:hypothetical protein
MAITLHSANSNADVSADALSIKTAQIAKNQQKVEGQMAMRLIQSATVEAVATPSFSSAGSIINISV